MRKRISLRSAKAWLPVFALTLAAFIINTSEFIPIGLLTDIASEFHITEAEAGVMISSYAWVVALLSLPLMMAVVKMDYRRLLLWTLGVFIACSVLSALSPGYIVLLAARMGVACSPCIFWGVAAALAVKVAPEGKRAVALGMIVTGTSIAMIIGLPLGRTIGLYMTWRMTFVSIAVTALLIALFLGMVFPKLPNTRPMTLHRLPVLFRNKALMSIYVFTLLTTTAHYTGYSYVEPFLAQVARLDENIITLVLMLVGLSGIVGSILFSRYSARRPDLLLFAASLGMAVSLLLLYPLSGFMGSVLALCFFWGIVYTLFNLSLQVRIMAVLPQASTISMTIYSAVFNLGIGCGTTIGGAVCTHASIAYIGCVGGIIALIAFVYCIRYVLHPLRPVPGRGLF